ncbi:hypothetical protein OU995_07490 [Roseateles sp. SL47]|nr:hypothetical protein [Roseateles sp. SL47]WAC74549.1 hypothetical protein OU995_07490 [Roseateles sp. SL47]
MIHNLASALLTTSTKRRKKAAANEDGLAASMIFKNLQPISVGV